MKNEQIHVRDWMIKAQQATPAVPGIPDDATCVLRIKLIAEELQEFANALGYNLYLEDDSKGQGEPRLRIERAHYLKPNLCEAYDGVCDLAVVVLGAGVALGTDVKPGFDEVMSSNDSKFIDGHRREDGKWIKGPSYRPANLQPVLDMQAERVPAYTPHAVYVPESNGSHGHCQH